METQLSPGSSMLPFFVNTTINGKQKPVTNSSILTFTKREKRPKVQQFL